MVWGIGRFPLSGGFYVEGEFEGRAQPSGSGWRERLKRDFAELLTAEEQAPFRDDAGNGAHWYASRAIDAFSLRHGFDRERRADQKISDHALPRYFAGGGSKKPIASLAVFSEGVMHVDDALKNFLEWLEPGVHRFVPIELRGPKNTVHPQPRYILLVGQIIDSVWPEMSGKDAIKSMMGKFVFHSDVPAHMRQLAFRKAVIEGKHLWYEQHIAGVMLCLSDRLRQEIADAGLKIPRQVQMRER